MPKQQFDDVLRFLGSLRAAHAVQVASDAQLLERFLTDKDAATFTALVRRHGPMVLGVCRRVLGDFHSAEDAFQATFLVLARRASAIRREKPLGNWLYGVAQRVALRARSQALAQRQRERRSSAMPHREPIDETTWEELRGILDEEVGLLPDKYRAPIVLCYFESKTHEQAAMELGWPTRSVTNRVKRGRELLRQQLVRRGVTLSAGALATALGEKAVAAPLGAMLTINTAKAASEVAAGQSGAAGFLSAQAIALAEEAIKGMTIIKGKIVLMVLTVGLIASAAALAARGEKTEMSLGVAVKSAGSVAPNKSPQKNELPLTTDLYGDPLPEGAMARLGTMRFRPGIAPLSLTFSPNGKLLGSVGHYHSRTVCLWDVTTGQAVQELSFLADYMAFAPDGKTLVAGSADLRLINVATGNELRRLETQTGVWYVGVVFSPDGMAVAANESGGQPPALVIWDVASGKEIRRIKRDREFTGSPAFSPDGKSLASATDDNAVRIFDVATGKENRKLEGHTKEVHSVCFLDGGKTLASADEAVVRFWNVQTRNVFREIKAGTGPFLTAVFSPDEKLLASGEKGGTIRIWETATGKELRRWKANAVMARSIAFAPDGRTLASSGTFDGSLRLWDAHTGTEIRPGTAHTGMVMPLMFGQDGKTLFSCAQDRKVLLWEPTTGRESRVLFAGPTDASEAEWSLTRFDLSPNGKVLARAGRKYRGEKPDEAIRLWDTVTGKEINTLNSHGEVDNLVFSPDGNMLTSSGKEGTQLWDAALGKELHYWPGAVGLAFSPDSKTLAGITADSKSACFLDTATGKELRRWEIFQNPTGALAFSPDLKLVASSDGNGTISILTADTGLELHRLGLGANGHVHWALAFSPSSTTLAAALSGSRIQRNGDRVRTWTIHLWEVRSGQEIRQFDADQGLISSFAFSPDDRTLASGGSDSTILLWDLTDQPKGRKVSPALLEILWADLADRASKAHGAGWAFALSPQVSTQFLKVKLQPIKPAPAKQVADLIADLESQRLAVRQNAAKALEELGETAEAAIRQALQGKVTLETRQRLELLLKMRGTEDLRKLRAIDVLERIATTEARQVLETLAKTSPNPQIADSASVALERSAKR
jgi:RNA polymerase sigma factor (sigma-70 family)